MSDIKHASKEQAKIHAAIAKISRETAEIYRLIDLEKELGSGSHDLNPLFKVARPKAARVE